MQEPVGPHQKHQETAIQVGNKAKIAVEPDEEKKESTRAKAGINRKKEDENKKAELPKDSKIVIKKRQTLEPDLDPTET